MTIRTACSSSLLALNEACMAIAKGDCESAIVGGTSLILAPDLFTRLSDQGVLSPDGSCKSFSADANGYARGEGILSVYIKSLSAALRDGNPIRSVIAGSGANFDGKTNPLTMPSATAQAALIRQVYEQAKIADLSKTGLFECHATGTYAGDPIEAEAIASVFGRDGIYVGTVKPNLGHSEGASGLTAVLKATLALEHRMIPPNIKYAPLNPRIPFEGAKLRIPEHPTPWPADRDERVSINSFGVGGSNAHIILESSASYLASRQLDKRDVSITDGRQLLLFSANTAQSLKDLIQNYQSFLGETPLNLIDVAYTLANGREHLPYRSFAVATKDEFDVSASVSSKKSGLTPPSLVLVFTGQGTAWPQMGRDLFLSNRTFSRTIKSLDKHLQSLGDGAPSWSLEEELLKPSRSSRVYEAEFSQPLCTALQIALVDALASIGVKPAAVVGHSSGEIAAAYAAEGLTAKEAIIVAFHRGASTKGRTERGGMAAVGLSWEEIQQYLVPGIVAACDNSPKSVTISGDADKLDSIVAFIKKAHPEVPATILKVEKAYHSHHMLALGDSYHQAMQDSGVVGTVPAIPFFSSVTGELFGSSKGSRLGPKYWQSNMEHPVLFRSAVQSILKSKYIKNEVFIELGPHSALAGPLRQILTAEGSGASYVSSLVRRQNSVENFLQVIGKLYALHVALDFKALVPGGSLIANLPCYPWDHSQRYWLESRVSKEWLGREHLYHTLLGAKLPESTDLEPVWRNLLQVSSTPWIVDHKLGDNIVFPLAGFVSIAAEAGRQATGIEDGVSLRNITVHNALVIDEIAPTEVVTTMRRQRLTDSATSEWWEFTISSHNGHVWTKHATGDVRGETYDKMLEHNEAPEELPRKVDSIKLYESTRKQGLHYGPSFNTLEQIRTSTGWPHKGTASMRNNQWGDEAQYHLHPVVLDTYYQLMSTAVFDGIGRDYRRMVAARIEFLTMFRCSENELQGFVTAKPTDEGYVADGWVSSGSKLVLRILGSHGHVFEEAEVEEENGIPITARCRWTPHVDFLRISNLIKAPQDHENTILLCEELAQLAISLGSQAAKDIDVKELHLIKYKEWLDRYALSNLDGSDEGTLSHAMESVVDQLRGTGAECVVAAITTVCRNAKSIFTREKTGEEVLNQDGILDNLTAFLQEQDDYSYFRHVAHTKPNISILEVCAGLGERTRRIVDSLTRDDGQPLYSQYVVADASSGMLNTRQENLKGLRNMEFTMLDVGRSLEEQGFEDRRFDLIIATNVVSTSYNVQRTLTNLHRLLHPDGKLLLEEPRPGLLCTKFALGTLPAWWSHAEDLDRIDEPFIDAKKWHSALVSAGFADIEEVEQTFKHAINNVLVARAQAAKMPTQRITLLCNDGGSDPRLIVEELESRGYEIDHCLLGQATPPGQDVLALLDEEQPFFEDMDAARLERFKALLGSLGTAGLLWVTRHSNVGCVDPRYAQVVGLARTLRSEMAIDFAVLEMDKVETPSGAAALANVLTKFQTREQDGDLAPDLEYAIHNGETLVNRIFPFELDQDLLVAQTSDEAVVTQTHLGRLNTLIWSSTSATAPADDEVEVELYATGLNFRDVLVGMQIIPGRDPKFGYEAAGVVRRVGSKVTRHAVGDRVIAMGISTFSTVITSKEVYFEKLPDHVSFVEGACIPLVFVTAVYGLRDVGRLGKGQSVLIHSGAGGVGLAAIQVAQMLGADIYTTVGSEKKVQYLMDTYGIPRNRIFNSRNASFVDDLMRETNGKGVDVALNSLAGELLHATWKCVAKWGTMVEIGKRDLLGNARLDMGPFLENRNYRCFDIDQMRVERPGLLNELLRFTMDCFAQGHFKPIRVDRVFSAPAVLEAFRYMQQGKHIGKIVIEIRNAAGSLLVKDVDANKKTSAGLHAAASYLLIGGLGGLGRSISVWMAQKGARNFTFLSRSAGSGAHDAYFVRELESMGCTVQLVRGDVANLDDVSRAVNGTVAPLKGIVQMSMVLRDQMFDGMSIEDWNAATRPKVQGTWNLHKATSNGIELDFFLLFSSLSGIVGQIGQANYASANTFLDAFVQYRTSMNLPCTAIDLGAMEGVGYLSENQELLKKMQGTGWSVVQETELLAALPLAMMSPSARSQRVRRTQDTTAGDAFLLGLAPTIPLSSPGSSARLKRDVRIAVYHNISAGVGKAGTATDGLRAFLATVKKDPTILRAEETLELLAMEIAKKLCSLVLAADTEVDISMNTADLGLDSLVAVEMRAWWKLTFGFDISTLDMLSSGTVEALGRRAVEGLIAQFDP